LTNFKIKIQSISFGAAPTGALLTARPFALINFEIYNFFK